MISAYIVAGEADFMLEVAVADLAAYEQLLLHTLLELPGVFTVRTNFAIHTAKEPGPLPLPAATR